LIIAVLVVVIVASAGFLILRNGAGQKAQDQNPPSATTTQTLSGSNEESNTITYTEGSFSPSSLTAKVGESITILNKSNETIQFASDPHPLHSDNAELNVGAIAPGETRTFMVSKQGMWKYHNHLASTERGNIVVQ